MERKQKINNTKIISLITLAGIIGMNTQFIIRSVSQSNNISTLTTKNISSNFDISKGSESNLNANKTFNNKLVTQDIDISNFWNQQIGVLNLML